MAVVKELIRKAENGSISFGNYELDKKEKVDNFEHQGDLYKVKTFKEITKLERNGMFVYESVPGTAVDSLEILEDGMTFLTEGPKDAQITVELESDSEYEVSINGSKVGEMKTNLGGKLSFNAELSTDNKTAVKIKKL